ncbi:MAG TPA: alpha/beta hydrolase [Leptospiraceae bacterium]|nr:alpha/beta hydrolase [Leptospiraceae bacterium]HMX58934.1 alpha/beta hydrolase [Leptospiraceae bacterium]HMY44721.1 alpha/beta hydrolase [Leptospiraceae bacterium]HNE23189.1 alpha/beta hydrolase [Leptospiraceae bacterium]HNJ05223.1 alpha/beta hydrolase [Leptospiraceae bacterium]
MAKKKQAIPKKAARKTYELQRVNFPSGSGGCEADLYIPKGRGNHPVVVMAHGFGAERSFRLPAFADRFAEAGIAVLLFDYRSFGDSPGEPRNLISPRMHNEDWKAALQFVRRMPGLDSQRIALWGTSFSGGHIVNIAPEEKPAALSLLVPFSDGFRTLFNYSAAFVLQAVFHGLWDLLLSLFGRSHNVPIIGKPEEFALLNTAECWEGYGGIVDKESAWQNSAPARICLTLPMYRPVAKASRIKCPVIIVAGEQDSLCPLPLVQTLARKIRGSMMMLLSTGHFEPYSGRAFEETVRAQLQFFRQCFVR